MKRYGFLMILFIAMVWGCSQDRSLSTDTHTTGWGEPTHGDFHGVRVACTGSQSCQSCHGEDYSGGDCDVACYDCHAAYPHPKTWSAPGYEAEHAGYLRKTNWHLTACKTCHGESYSGGSSGATCLSCHDQPGGPEACNVCHGNAEHAHPPNDLAGNSEITYIGVGAHELHMDRYQKCETCHVVPESFADSTHIDGLPAEVLAKWEWDRESQTCGHSCHWAKNKTYVWTE